MIWLAWRRQKTETLIAAALVALLAAWLVPAGLHMATVFHGQGLAACAGRRSNGCDDLVSAFTGRFEKHGAVNAWLNFVPGLIGVLLAAPILLELERGTYRLTWTQSITRARFASWRIAFALASGVVAALVFSGLLTWFRVPLDRLDGRMSPGVFDVEGTVTIGYVLFATAFALAVGVLWRRAVPALAIAFVGYGALRIFVTGWLRQRFMSPVSATWHVTGRTASPLPRDAWEITEYASDRHGHAVHLTHGCSVTSGPSCLTQHKPQWSHITYQPASRFWAFQGIETALYLGLGAALVMFAIWWMRERIT